MYADYSMLKLAVTLAGLVAGTSAHGAGAWKDPNHYVDDNSLAGLRFISEGPPHQLTIVGTDDGKTWWALSGSCANGEDGSIMTEITIDFSPKGGPANAKGTWAGAGQKGDYSLKTDHLFAHDEPESITFPDGNKWTAMKTPSPGILSYDGVVDHVGFFKDPHHYKEGTWAGLRVIAEFPPHVLTMVGSDDGDPHGFWGVKGSCTGARMTEIHFDFSPKGGPPDLTAVWTVTSSFDSPEQFSLGLLLWPDTNSWSKFGVHTKESSALAESESASRMPVLSLASAMLVAFVAAVSIMRRRKLQAAEQTHPQLV